LRVDFIAKPDYLLMPEFSVRSGCWFWQENGLDRVDVDLSEIDTDDLLNELQGRSIDKSALANLRSIFAFLSP
jgi:hypothetical protein